MDFTSMMSGVLSREDSCSNCGSTLPSHVAVCPACGCAMADDPSLSVVATASLKKHPNYRPLEQSVNYLHFKKVVDGIRKGTTTPDEFSAVVTHLHAISVKGLHMFDDPAMKKKLARGKGEEKATAREMLAAFALMEKGLRLLLDYTPTASKKDLDEGADLTEKGFIALDRAEIRALGLV